MQRSHSGSHCLIREIMNVSFLYGFITGCLTTAIVLYYVQKLIDNRNRTEQIKNKKFDLDRLFNDYPDFMGTLKCYINDPNCVNIREFFVVDKNAILNSSIPRFRFELSEDILPVLKKLEDLGYIQKINNNCLLYKIGDNFMNQLKYAIKND